MTKPNKALKIGLVFDDSLDRPDGVQQYVQRIAEYLESQGHEVHFLVGETARRDLPNLHSLSKNLKVKFNGNTMSMPLPASSRQIGRLLDKLQLDVIHVQAPYSPFMSGKVLKQAWRQNIPVVGAFHILPYSKFVIAGNKFLAACNASTKKYITEMMAVSPPAQQFAKAIYGYEGRVVPNPIRVADFTFSPGKPNKIPHILFLGRLVERKGALQLLKALSYEKPAVPFRVTIAGRGEMLEELKRFAQENELDNVDFPGFIAENEKARLLESADIVALPSISGESFGISVVEALAAARGVVLAGNNPGYASVLHGLPELLVDPLDTASFSNEIIRWLSSPEDRSTMAIRQKEYARQFDIHHVGKQVVDTYERALQNRSQS